MTGPPVPRARRAMIRKLFVDEWPVNRVAKWSNRSWGVIWRVYRLECERRGQVPVHKKHPETWVWAIVPQCPYCGGKLDFEVEFGTGRTLEVCFGSPQDGLRGCGIWLMERRRVT